MSTCNTTSNPEGTVKDTRTFITTIEQHGTGWDEQNKTTLHTKCQQRLPGYQYVHSVYFCRQMFSVNLTVQKLISECIY